MNEPEILFVLPCDDVRQEINGKLIAIGMYTDAFVPASLPTNFTMAFILLMKIPAPGVYTVACEIWIEPDTRPVAKIGFDFEAVEASERSGIPLPPFPLMAGQEGAIVMKAGIVPKEVLRLPIRLPSAPSVLPLPPEQSQPAARAT